MLFFEHHFTSLLAFRILFSFLHFTQSPDSAQPMAYFEWATFSQFTAETDFSWLNSGSVFKHFFFRSLARLMHIFINGEKVNCNKKTAKICEKYWVYQDIESRSRGSNEFHRHSDVVCSQSAMKSAARVECNINGTVFYAFNFYGFIYQLTRPSAVYRSDLEQGKMWDARVQSANKYIHFKCAPSRIEVNETLGEF